MTSDCAICGKPVTINHAVAVLNDQITHLKCYEKWHLEQARLRQKEEDEL